MTHMLFGLPTRLYHFEVIECDVYVYCLDPHLFMIVVVILISNVVLRMSLIVFILKYKAPIT